MEAQEALLRKNGAEIIYKDSFTGTKMDRPEFDKLMQTVTAGDKIIAVKLDRLSRTAGRGMDLIQKLLNKGVAVHILNMGLIDNSPTGKLITQVMLAFAEFERDMIIERTSEGKAIARQRPGFHEGRPQKFEQKKIALALKLLEDNSYKVVSEMTGISVSTLIRAKRRQKAMNCE